MAFPLTQFGTPQELDLEICKDSKYLMYCDPILSKDERFEHWYQYFNLAIAAVGLFLPLALWGSKYLLSLWREWKRQKSKVIPLDKTKRRHMARMKKKPPVVDPGATFGDAAPKGDATPSPFVSEKLNSGKSGKEPNNPKVDSVQTQGVPSSSGGTTSNLSSRSSRGRQLDATRGAQTTDVSRNTSSSPENQSSSIFSDSESGRQRSASVESAVIKVEEKKTLSPLLDGGEISSPSEASVNSRDTDDDGAQSVLRTGVDAERAHRSANESLVEAGSVQTSSLLASDLDPSSLQPDAEVVMKTEPQPEEDSEMNFNPLQNFDLRITPLFSTSVGDKEDHQFAKSSRAATGAARKTVVGLVDLQDIGQGALSEAFIVETAAKLDLLRAEKGCAGLIFRISDSLNPQQVGDLFRTLCQQRVGIMVMCDPDVEILRSIDFGLLIGAIFENSTICSNGQRRDFFRTIRLREVMGRCADERLERPKFFIGFHDMWHTRPTAAVVRRAFKIAEFYGATLVQEETRESENPQRNLPISMSGFDYLKSKETIDLQKSWMSETRKLNLDDASDPAVVARVPIDELREIVPTIEELLTPFPTLGGPNEKSEYHVELPLPDFASDAPQRSDFWSVSSNGEEFSAHGCFPLICGPSPRQYNALLDSQKHLKKLKMLQTLEGIEIIKLTDRLETLRATSQQRGYLDELIHGLTFNEIHIYTGLDAGFWLPGEIAHVWGMSASSETDPNHVDIFISQQAPSNVGTVLHTFLAHRGVSREIRFEEELRLEQANVKDSSCDIPISIRSEISQATNGELLFLLQQIRISKLQHPLVSGIQKACSFWLIEDSSRVAWNEVHSHQFLEGSVTMQDVLQMRLEEYTRRGARQLPSIDNLMELFKMIDSLICDALFMARRDVLDLLSTNLSKAFDPSGRWSKCQFVDINADLVALMFFCSLRKCALEDVYLETTDRCPFFLPQPDQAAVFSELWVLGSQCETFFGILPRPLGAIIYDKYRKSLQDAPPPVEAWNGADVFTSYSFTHNTNHISALGAKNVDVAMKVDWYNTWKEVQETFMEFGALSIFCMPAIVDVILLTFYGRGLFLTVFMDNDDRMVASYALLGALLISAGNTGWVGSVGGHYLYNFAFDNMNYFLIQRLSSGFVLSVVVGLCGLCAFGVQYSARIGGIFVGYLIVLCAYLYVIGILATMHRKRCPLTSGRMVLWRTFPFLLISPVISTFIRGHDLLIYLTVLYVFLILLLVQYRNLCHEWSTWTNKVPVITTEEVTAWYQATLPERTDDNEPALTGDALNKAAQIAFQLAVESHTRGEEVVTCNESDMILVKKAAKGLPFALWLLEKDNPSPTKKTGAHRELFTKAWLVQVEQGLKNVQQVAQGLKQHSIFILFREGRYDMAQSLGLFLVALMDHWVDVVTSAVVTRPGPYTFFRSRFGMGFCVLYFLVSAIALDATLWPYWEDNAKLPDDKLVDSKHAQIIAKRSAAEQRARWASALWELITKMSCIFGLTTLTVWLFVKDDGQVIMYYMYIIGYSGVLVFQFNRCFTTNLRAHVLSVFFSALVGFLVGCILHSNQRSAPFVYNDIVALVISSVLAASLTTIWIFIDPELQAIPKLAEGAKDVSSTFISQQRLGTEGSARTIDSRAALTASTGPKIESSVDSPVTREITELLKLAMSRPNVLFSETKWALRLLSNALDSWRSGNIVITVSNRQLFVENDLEDSWSFSKCHTGKIGITAGFLDASEVQTCWDGLNTGFAHQLAETILYHTAMTALGLSHRQACLAEHLLHETTAMSHRIRMQLATEDEGSLIRITRRTNLQLMKSLCLGLEVDLEWQNTTEDLRRAVFARVVGDSLLMTPTTVSRDVRLEDFHVHLSLQIFQSAKERLKTRDDGSGCSTILSASGKGPVQLQCKRLPHKHSRHNIISRCCTAIVRSLVTVSKWIAIISGGASDVERELWYSLRHVYFRVLLLWVLLTVWKICWLIRNMWITMFLMHRRQALSRIIRLAIRGSSRVLIRNSIIVELPQQTVTGFASLNEAGGITLQIFDECLEEIPEGKQPFATAVYDGIKLQSRTDTQAGREVTSTYHYGSHQTSRYPMYKDIVEPNRTLRHRYDDSGRVISGSMILGATEYAFDFFYRKYPKQSNDILSAKYHQVGVTENELHVFWCVSCNENPAEDDMAVPSEKITRVIRKIGKQTYVTKYIYEHKRDPRTSTELQELGQKTPGVESPKLFDMEDQFLQKPANLSFDFDDLFVHHSPHHANRMFQKVSSNQPTTKPLSRYTSFLPFGSRYWRRNAIYRPISTWRLRAELWKLWLHANQVDAVAACWIDELILREEPLLRRYWKLRDVGRLAEAKRFLDKRLDNIVSAIEMPFEVSQTCILPIKPADLYTMGLGKDATQITARPEDCYKDTKDRISIIFNDVGCWPDAPGGVSNCRRDLVNGHETIRNHVLVESAHDYGISRFQLEKNVQSIKQLPLWGLDFKTAHHGLIDNLLQAQVDEKRQSVDAKQDIVDVFIPLLRCFVKGARTKRSSREDLISCSNALLSMSTYFEKKDYNRTWQSKEVQIAWIDAWMHSYEDPNILDASELFEIERPSMGDFREVLNLYVCYFFIYSVEIPADCPRVFQSTHHGISSLFGMVLKYRTGTTFGIWDHAILWRECCLNFSTAQCLLPISVQSMLLAGIGLAARLAYLHVDVLLPCTSVFNPTWENEIGTDSGRIGSQKLFARKIDPIANGISNMSSFSPTDDGLSEKPTVVMLSNIQTIKDVKAAVLAADIIVNEFGFQDYRLHIYGAQDRQPIYTMETLQLIADRNLAGKVMLAGFGNPKQVLKDAWLFMNSSLSEGLPLAIGEAALTGVPIVATEVGGTSLVLTDPDDKDRKYGEVVPPNDPMALARAQVNILAMLGQWTSYTDDQGPIRTLPNVFLDEDVEWITKRMYEKSEDRKKLGLLCRDVVLRSFHGTRYLREHEQMYWVQWHRARITADEELENEAKLLYRFGTPLTLRCEGDKEDEDDAVNAISVKKSSKKFRWQDFAEVRKPKSLRRRADADGVANARLPVGDQAV